MYIRWIFCDRVTHGVVMCNCESGAMCVFVISLKESILGRTNFLSNYCICCFAKAKTKEKSISTHKKRYLYVAVTHFQIPLSALAIRSLCLTLPESASLHSGHAQSGLTPSANFFSPSPKKSLFQTCHSDKHWEPWGFNFGLVWWKR